MYVFLNYIVGLAESAHMLSKSYYDLSRGH